jgi:hypothetical protein
VPANRAKSAESTSRGHQSEEKLTILFQPPAENCRACPGAVRDWSHAVYWMARCGDELPFVADAPWLVIPPQRHGHCIACFGPATRLFRWRHSKHTARFTRPLADASFRSSAPTLRMQCCVRARRVARRPERMRAFKRRGPSHNSAQRTPSLAARCLSQGPWSKDVQCEWRCRGEQHAAIPTAQSGARRARKLISAKSWASMCLSTHVGPYRAELIGVVGARPRNTSWPACRAPARCAPEHSSQSRLGRKPPLTCAKVGRKAGQVDIFGTRGTFSRCGLPAAEGIAVEEGLRDASPDPWQRIGLSTYGAVARYLSSQQAYLSSTELRVLRSPFCSLSNTTSPSRAKQRRPGPGEPGQ